MKRTVRIRAQYRPEPDIKKLITVLLAVARQQRDAERDQREARHD